MVWLTRDHLTGHFTATLRTRPVRRSHCGGASAVHEHIGAVLGVGSGRARHRGATSSRVRRRRELSPQESASIHVIAGIDALLLVCGAFFITRPWVKRAAVLYAERLMEALDLLV
jgi:hypothetical protein